MTDTDFHARRTELSNTFAAAGAQLLDYMRCAGALAAIPNTQQYVVAGDPAAIRAQLDTVDPQRRMRHGDRPEQPLYFGPETGQPRRWAALITSAGHGMLQEYGTKFEYAQPGQEVLEVMEILPGAANKAAEEGGLLDELVKVIAHWKCDSCGGIGHDGESHYQGHFQPPEPYPCSDCQGAGLQREEFCNKAEIGAFISQFSAIAADRTSLQVANKAEVDLTVLPEILREAANILSGNQEMRRPIVDELDGFALMVEAAAPPATTGASTADLEAQLAECMRQTQKWASAAGVADGRAVKARDLALEEAARICENVNHHENPKTARDCADAIRSLQGSEPMPDWMVSASTVLTDERIMRLSEESTLNWWTEEGRPDNPTIIDFARAIEREVAARAGQVAPGDLHDAIMRLPCKPGRAISMHGASLQAYKEGHRDARHAAADLASGVEAGQVAVPEGWKLVPVELTDSMRYAYERDAVSGRIDVQGYAAMLAAAPSAPAVAQQAPADLRNITAVKRISDQSLTITFASCRACSEFERAAPSPAKESK